MVRKRIAIACQGGGSQCAFVAGALKALFDGGIDERYEIVGLSGTSGGALTAALAWMGLLKRAQGDRTPIADRILACWHDLTAQTPQEIAFDRTSVELMRLAEQGMMPTYARSPSSLPFQLWSRAAAAALGRPEFTDLGALLLKHLDFAALPALVKADSPVLLVGAADVLEGTVKVFTSARGEIKLESLLASAAIPTLFPAVWVDGHAYWDGIFGSNPPVSAFLRHAFMGAEPFPQEIWVVQVNRSRHDTIPETPAEISDRRNHLAGNLSLQHELKLIQLVNTVIETGALTEEFRARIGMDTIEPIAVRFIRMTSELQATLDYPSKLSRVPRHIERLIADGMAQATAFLAALAEVGQPLAPIEPSPLVESVEPSAPPVRH